MWATAGARAINSPSAALFALVISACATPLPLSAEPAEWVEMATVDVDDQGRSTRFAYELSAGEARIALRVSPLASEPTSEALCYRLAPLESEATGTLVGPPEAQGRDLVCTQCAHRVYATQGAGVFVFPNDGTPLRSPDRLEGAAQLLDCETGVPASRARFPAMPRQLRVERAVLGAPAAERGRIELVLSALEGSGYEDAESREALLARPGFESAFAFVGAAFAEVGIDVVLVRVTSGGDGAVRWSTGSEDALRRVSDDIAEAHEIAPDGFAQQRLALAACLERDDPLEGRDYPIGFATGVPVGGRSPSLILVATGACTDGAAREPLSGEPLGRAIAHELGHALGLHHSDQPEGAHLPRDLRARLMDANPFSVDPEFAHFSEAEGRVVRMHPSVLPERP